MAQSSVTLYGQADMFVGGVKSPGSGERAWVANSGGMQTSYWGIKGTEDLGGGTKAIFDLNGFFRTDSGNSGRFNGDSMFSRNAYVGLQNDKLGTLKLGRNTTPYFISTILFNPLVDSYVFSPTIFHTYFGAASNGVVDPGIIGDSGWNNSVLYSTPNFGGLSANLIYSAGEKAGAAGKNKWGGNLMYFNGPFAATVAYQQVRFNAVPDDLSSAGLSRQDAVLGGITYDFKVVKLFAQGQYIKTKASTAASGDIKHTNGQVGASVPVGAGNVLAPTPMARPRTRSVTSSATRLPSPTTTTCPSAPTSTPRTTTTRSPASSTAIPSAWACVTSSDDVTASPAVWSPPFRRAFHCRVRITSRSIAPPQCCARHSMLPGITDRKPAFHRWIQLEAPLHAS